MRAFLVARWRSAPPSPVITVRRRQSPRFFPDDPLWTDDDTLLDASKVGAAGGHERLRLRRQQFGSPGEKKDVRAMNVNTLDEVPDSMWFTNRIGRESCRSPTLVRGPGHAAGDISIDNWS